MLEIHMKLSETEPDFSGEKAAPKIGKMDQKWAKNRVFEFIEKPGHSFLLNLSCNENLHHLLCSCTDSIFVHEIWVKIYSANQNAGFFNQLYLQDKLMK